MTPEERARIARENGAKSKGPKSETGKEKSSRNALKHGDYAQKLSLFAPHLVVTCNEDSDEFKLQLAELVQIYLPINQLAAGIVRAIAIANWQIERLNHCLTMSWNVAIVDTADAPSSLAPELAETETMVNASRHLYSGDAIAQRINRQIDQLELRVARLERRLKFAHANFPTVAELPVKPKEPEIGNEPTVYITENKPEVIAAYKLHFPNCKIVVLPPDHVAKGIEVQDDMPDIPRKVA